MHVEKYGCREVVDLLSDYIDGECTSQVEGLIDAHLADCPHCIAFVNTFRKSVKMTKALDYGDIPKDLRIRLHRVLERKIPLEESPPEMSDHPFKQSGRTLEEEDRI